MKDASCVGAFFDLDGTLLERPSVEWRFAMYLMTRDEIPVRSLGRWLAHTFCTAMRGPRRAIVGNKFYLSGLRESLVAEWERAVESGAVDKLRFFVAGLERIDWHLAQGHHVFVVSGTLEPLAQATLRRIRRDLGVCATRLEVRGAERRWTGALIGEHMSGQAKARALHDLAAQHGLALNRSYAYGNAILDRSMLEAVGHPRAVNASWRLADLALSRGWELCDWGALGTVPAGSAHADRDGYAIAAMAGRETR